MGRYQFVDDSFLEMHTSVHRIATHINGTSVGPARDNYGKEREREREIDKERERELIVLLWLLFPLSS